MTVPADVTTYEGELATLWFDEHGILYANAKSTPRTLAKQQEMYRLITEITKGQKVCLMADVTYGPSQDKELREYMAAQIPLHFKAMAVISDSSFGQLVTNTFTNFEQPIPMRMFKQQDDAVTWLKGFL